MTVSVHKTGDILITKSPSAQNNSRSPDIVRPNFENVWPISHYDRPHIHNISPAHLELPSRFCQSINYGFISRYI